MGIIKACRGQALSLSKRVLSSLLSIHGFVRGAGLILIIILSAIPSINASATTIGLTYDDGGAEGFWSDYYPNGIAVRFTPPISRWRITAILIHGFAIFRGEVLYHRS
ncbi:MAG: hypothetical protein FGF50_10125 [Candidatus Brockarchaeota archaeon]|nr:hypothetical protein [Candidatus Brockarchaeota archaeon]